jgi:hypothetical protein
MSEKVNERMLKDKELLSSLTRLRKEKCKGFKNERFRREKNN